MWDLDVDVSSRPFVSDYLGVREVKRGLTSTFDTHRMRPSYIAAAVNNFFPSVVSTLGYSRNITYCLTARKYGADTLIYDLRYLDAPTMMSSFRVVRLCHHPERYALGQDPGGEPQRDRRLTFLNTDRCSITSIVLHNQRYLHIACPLVITVVANILAVATTKTAPRYVAMMLMPASFYAR
jgi:hypothetical protein